MATPPARAAWRALGALLVASGLSAPLGVGRACTLWAAAGAEAGGGTLLAKNRDFRPDHRQVLRLVRPATGHRYLALLAEDGDEPGIKAGTNERGLTVVSASASTIPRARRASQPGKHGVLAAILGGYDSVEALLADAPRLLGSARAMFLLASDRREVARIEIGLDGRYAIERTSAGWTAQTNHFLDGRLLDLNQQRGPSSVARLARVRALLAGAPRPLDEARFAAISQDRVGGPDDALWRSGREHTLASWIVRTPPDGPPHLQLLIANPGEPQERRDLVLDDAFWAAGPSDARAISP
jgi:hypothetical protein